VRTVETLYHLARADLLSRVRQDRFLLVLGVTVVAGVLCVPPIDAGYNSLVIGGSRGIYNSAWIGAVLSVQVSLLLSLLGFYLVRGNITLDDQTQVGPILASTPVSRSTYVLGKWFSSLAVLGLILGILACIAPLMQLVRAEDATIDLVALCLPVWTVGLPVMGLVAALAVLCEVLPVLRGSLGSIAYFFLWTALVFLGPGRLFLSMDEQVTARDDLFGLSPTLASIQQTMLDQGLDPGQGTSDLFVPSGWRPIVRFQWTGVRWTARALVARLVWLGLTAIVAALSGLVFDRFDPARWRRRANRRSKRPGRTPSAPEPIFRETPASFPAAQLTAVSRYPWWSTLPRLVWAELILALKGHTWWWYTIAAGLVIASWFSPLELVRRRLLPLAWLWPTLVWSEMGMRARRHDTEAMLSTVAYPVWRQVAPAWIAGLIVTLVIGGGAALHLLLQSGLGLEGVIVGSVFVPALALALGVWSGQSRWFDAIYLLWWFGMVSGIAACDFVGLTGAGHPWLYFGLAAVLIGAAAWGKEKQDRP